MWASFNMNSGSFEFLYREPIFVIQEKLRRSHSKRNAMGQPGLANCSPQSQNEVKSDEEWLNASAWEEVDARERNSRDEKNKITMWAAGVRRKIAQSVCEWARGGSWESRQAATRRTKGDKRIWMNDVISLFHPVPFCCIGAIQDASLEVDGS